MKLFGSTLASIVFLLVLTGCSIRGIPTHGGGKRFYEEQVCLSAASKKALEEISWEKTHGKKLNLYVMSIGDAGGGAALGGGFDFKSSLTGYWGVKSWKAGEGISQAAGSAAQGTATFDRGQYMPYAFANANDLEYLKGLVMESILKAGGTITEADEKPDTDIYVMVDNFGTNKWRWDVLFYATENLSAQVRLHVFAVDRKTGEFTALGKGERRLTYWENYILIGIGPLNNGQIRYDLTSPEP